MAQFILSQKVIFVRVMDSDGNRLGDLRPRGIRFSPFWSGQKYDFAVALRHHYPEHKTLNLEWFDDGHHFAVTINQEDVE